MRLLQRPTLQLLRYSPTLTSLIASPTTTSISTIPTFTPPSPPLLLLQQQSRAMSDDAYAAFLAKQNQDYSGGDSSPSVATKATPKTPANPVLQAFKTGERVYTSEADEPFEPVLLEWQGESLPGSEEFAKLVQAQGGVEVLEVKEWDPKGEYDDVVEAVKKVGNGVVKVYQVGNGARVEYFVVTKSEEGVVGVRAKAVET